jgi:general secretion pathway protein A
MTNFESYFGFKKPPFSDSPDSKQFFDSHASRQVNQRLAFLIEYRGAALLTGEVGAGKSTAARVFLSQLHPNLFKILYLHFSSGSALDLLRQLALALDLQPAHRRGDLVRQIADSIVRLNQDKKQHPILVCDEAHLLPHSSLEQLPLLLNFDMDSSRLLSLLLIGQPLLRRTLSLQIHEALRQRIAVCYHIEGLSRDELDAYLAQQLKLACGGSAARAAQSLFDDAARQCLYQATKGIPRKVNKLALTALRLAAERQLQVVGEPIVLDATAEALL